MADQDDAIGIAANRHILDDWDFKLVLANAAHVKNVPGRKTDVNDAMWLAELLAHGLIRASFVPDTQTQEMRNLLRTRRQLVREQSSHVLRVQKTLEDANIKLDSVLRFDGQEWSRHDRGADCRRNQPRQTGQPCRSAGEGVT
jgi:transposase